MMLEGRGEVGDRRVSFFLLQRQNGCDISHVHGYPLRYAFMFSCNFLATCSCSCFHALHCTCMYLWSYEYLYESL